MLLGDLSCLLTGFRTGIHSARADSNVSSGGAGLRGPAVRVRCFARQVRDMARLSFKK